MFKNYRMIVRLFNAGLLIVTLSCSPGMKDGRDDRPNFLWITAEDINPFIGAFGDSVARTPHLDALAAEGVRYTNTFATAPVCSPARGCLITGVYASSLGTMHLRSEVSIPEHIPGFPVYLRNAGYYCTNNEKTDYNFDETGIWDESGGTAHWRNRPGDVPFFSVFNIETTHQSRIFGSDSAFYEKYGRLLKPEERQDPARMPVPPYHFDTPEVRKLWARYYDLVTILDRQVGAILAQLEEDGLSDNTWVFFFSDHGTGMPRSKRALFDSGLRVPLIVRAPAAYRQRLGLTAGSTDDRLIDFADFAPTMLRLLDLALPQYLHGQPFIGEDLPPKAYTYGTSDRVDEAFELSRTVRSRRYRYIRNYYPHLPLLQPNFYTDQSEIMRELHRVLASGVSLTPAQQAMWQPRRAPEELYDLTSDPFEVRNLAGEPEYRAVLEEHRMVHRQWVLDTRDAGLCPEPAMHRMAEGRTVYEAMRDTSVVHFERLLSVTDLMLRGADAIPDLLLYSASEDVLQRYWAVKGLEILGDKAQPARDELLGLLDDPAPEVRLAAVMACCNIGACDRALPVLLREMENPDEKVVLMAVRAFQELGGKAALIRTQMADVRDRLCAQSAGKSKGYDLYACWSLLEAFKE
jgi:N-sulfoglucosamine sulfohydrolase